MLLADFKVSGGQWIILEAQKVVYSFKTQGLNLTLASPETFAALIQKDVAPSVKARMTQMNSIVFYAAGIRKENEEFVSKCLREISPKASIRVHNDSVAAVHALCFQGVTSFACILHLGGRIELYFF